MADFENTMWNVDMEVNLFHAMRRHKPVGVNRYFQMMFIHEKLNNSSSRKITSKQIWKHLMEMYDLQALNESEIIPFPNRETEFQLPDTDYHSLVEKSYPRFEGNISSIEEAKSEKSEGKSSKEGKGSSSGDKSKNDSKSSSKSDSKSSSTPKESKSEGRGSSTPHGKDKSEGKAGKDSSKGSSTPHGKESKSDSKGSSTPLGAKGGKSSSQSGGASAASTPESTPKRKRTRQTNSANASPATPSDSHPPKRGRR